MILNNDFGAIFGLKIQNKPHYLEDTQQDIELAAKIINENLDCHLPVIYISSDKRGFYFLSDNEIMRLAKELAGIAHIVIEPNYNFSVKLSRLTNHANPYLGHIGVYWTNGNGRNIFYDKSTYQLFDTIKNTIISSVSNRRSLDICTYNFIQNQYAIYQQKEQSEIGELFTAASNETEQWKNKVKFLEDKLKEAEDEIKRLKQELNSSNKIFNINQHSTNALILNCHEKDLYSSEIKDIILTILEESKNSNEPYDRRIHILNSILEQNSICGEGKQLRDTIKKVLHGYTKLDKKTERDLKGIGFQISDEKNKHIKISFNGDVRYSYALTATGGDSQSGGQNAATKLCRLLGLK